jgi:hypothetical protein
LSTGQSAYFANGGHSAKLAFTNGAHYGFMFTLILAVFGFILAFRVHNKSKETVSSKESEPLDNKGESTVTE